MTIRSTELVFILDRSGSMSGLERDTIGGFNSMIAKQKKEEGHAYVTTVLFSDRMHILHDRVDIQRVQPLTEKQYFTGGSTALLDAIGNTVSRIMMQQRMADASQRGKVLVVITTDGEENASREYSQQQIQNLIETQRKVEEWEFLFLGANIDAVEAARHVGIPADRAVRYHSDSIGTGVIYESVSKAASSMRSGVRIGAQWSEAIAQDYQERTLGSDPDDTEEPKA